MQTLVTRSDYYSAKQKTKGNNCNYSHLSGHSLKGHSLLLFVVEIGIDMLGCSKACCFAGATLVQHVGEPLLVSKCRFVGSWRATVP